MINHSLTTKSRRIRQRKAIIMVLIMMIVLTVVTGIGGGDYETDNTVYKATVGETIVAELAPPSEGTPQDFDALSSLKFAAYKLHHSTFFRGETDGVAVADIGIATYEQRLRNTRVVKGENTVFAETVSSSSLKNVGEQKYADNGIIVYRPSVSVKNGVAKFSDTAYRMTYEAFADGYGTVPNQLSKYIINEDTILSVVDENAVSVAAKNAPRAVSEDGAEGGTLDYYVPQELVPDENGNYMFTVTLDPESSTRYYRNEMRTLAGADKHPKFYSATVTIEIDGEWNPIRVTTVENYDIAIPVIGAMNCTGTNVETFYQLNDPDGVVPEQDFFQPYIDAAKVDPDYVPPAPPPTVASPADYLAAAFAPYLSGEEALTLEADVVSDAISVYGLTISANLATYDIQAAYDDLYVKYAGEKVYLRLNELNGYIETAKFKDLLSADPVAELLAGLGDIRSIDFDSLFGGDILGTVFANCEMTNNDGTVRIHMPFALDLAPLGIDTEAKIDASIYIRNEDKKLVSITADVTVFDTTIGISAQPPKRAPRFPSTDGATDISGILDFLPDIITTAKQQAFGISGTVSANGYDIAVDGYIDVSDGLSVDATINALGLDVGIEYIDGKIFATLGNIVCGGTADELPVLIDALKPLLGNSFDIGKILDAVKPLLPTTVADYIGMINNITVTDDALTVELSALTVPVTLEISRGDGRINGVKFALDVDMFGIEFDAAANLAVTAPELREITPPESENIISFAQLATLVTDAMPYLSAQGFDITLNGNAAINGDKYDIAAELALDVVNGLAAEGSVAALGQTAQITFADGTLYAALGNIRVALDTAKLDALTSPLSEILDSVAELPALDIGALLGRISSVSVNDDGTLVAIIRPNGANITATINFATGNITLDGAIDGIDVTVAVAVKTADAHGITAPNGEYVMLDVLGTALDAVADIIAARSLVATAQITLADTVIDLGLELSFANGIAARITENTFGAEAILLGDEIFVSLGDIRVTGKLSELPALFAALESVLPEDIANTVNGVSDKLQNGYTVDVPAALDALLAAITSLTATGYKLDLGIGIDGVSARVSVNTDLSEITVTADIDGAAFAAKLADVKPHPVEIRVDGEYAKITDLTAVASSMLPLAKHSAFDVAIDAEMFGTKIRGDVYLFLGDKDTPFTVNARLAAGDVPIGITVVGDMLYLSVADSLYIKEQLSETAILDIAAKLDYALPGIEAAAIEMMELFRSMTLEKILSCIALAPTDNGFALILDMNGMGMNVRAELGFDTTGGKFGALSLDCDISGAKLCATLDTVTENGVLKGFSMTEASEHIDALEISVTPALPRAVAVDTGKYIPLADITRLIKPLFDTFANANTAKSVALDISGLFTTANNANTAIIGKVLLSLDPLAVDATLTLFAGSADEIDVEIRYTQNTLYIKAGNIALSLDTANDFARLYDVLAEYLPEYINHEIAKLFGLEQGTSAFSDISLVINRFKEIAAATDTRAVIGLLFKPLDGIGSGSAVKTVLDMLTVFERDGKLAVGLNVLGMTLNLTPEFDTEYTELVGATIDTNIAGCSIAIRADGLALSESGATIAPPENAADYVSIIEFIETINNAVHTFTQTDSDGNITFELKTLDFDYKIFDVETTTDENGNTVNVKDEAGRDKPRVDEFGNKVVGSTIKVYNKPGYSALKGKFVRNEEKNENGETVSTNYRFNLEAHIVLDISSLANSTPLTLDLYIVNEDGNGMAFLDYMEGNGNGERISIDYTSIMQIVATVLDILGMDDEVTEFLVGDYRLNIDKTVFESMDIAGLDSVRVMLANIVDAIHGAENALDHAKNGWNLIATAGSIDGLNARLDDVKAQFGAAIDGLKAALAPFVKPSDDDAPTDDTKPSTEINGKLFKQIVTGVTLKKDDDRIWATVENEITTNTPGRSSITVMQNNNKIDRINVSGLDVNTAKLENFDALFTAGEQVTIALPDDYNTTQGNATYSDFSNLKHLLFDVMNTANMLEFDIGDTKAATSENKIELGIKLLGLESIKVSIQYSVKVRIIDQGAGANPRYKTAAIVELVYKNCSALGQRVFPDCTTRLYFYDNVLYVHGVTSWDAGFFGTSSKNVKYIDTAYTIEQLGNMLSAPNGMDKLLNEMLFYLLPIRESILGINIRQQIAESIQSDGSDKAAPAPTIATVFKGYSYTDGEHKLTIGLSELAEAPGSNMLGDLNISLTGKNDGDTNILDNYISAAGITLSLINSSACTINLRLFATLRNATIIESDGTPVLRSSGLSATTDGYDMNGVINTVIPNTNWQYLWQ